MTATCRLCQLDSCGPASIPATQPAIADGDATAGRIDV